MTSLPGFLSRERLIAWSVIFLVVETALFVFLVLQQNNVVMPVGPSSIDFVSFYAAGKLALAGTPALAYDQAAHYTAEQQATAPGVPYVFFFYPPVFLLICAAFASMPYLLAYAVFQATTFALFAYTLRRILGISGWTWLLPVIAFPATFWNIGQGQNAFLTASLLGGFGLLLDRRPVAAGAMIGALCFKPHLGLLAPVALAAARRWAAFAAAATTSLALVGLSILLLGWDTWRAYFVAMSGADSVYTSGRINFAGFVSLFGGLRLAGLPVTPSYLIQAAITLLCIIAIGVIWRHRAHGPAAYAALMATTMIAVPLFLLYDQVFAIVAIAWLVGDPNERGLTNGEKLLLVALYPLALMAPVIALGAHIPLGLVVSTAIAALCLRRAFRRDVSA